MTVKKIQYAIHPAHTFLDPIGIIMNSVPPWCSKSNGGRLVIHSSTNLDRENSPDIGIDSVSRCWVLPDTFKSTSRDVVSPRMYPLAFTLARSVLQYTEQSGRANVALSRFDG